MAYELPTFNLRFSQWLSPRTPQDGAPDIENIPGQLYIQSRFPIDMQPVIANSYIPPIIIRYMEASLDPHLDDIFVAETLPGEYYKARAYFRMHAGFPNEYMSLLVVQCDADGTTPRTF